MTALTACTGREGHLPAGAACALLTSSNVTDALGSSSSNGVPATSDSGPSGVVGCSYHTSSHDGLTVWLLSRGSSAMFASQEAAPAARGHHSLDVPGGHGFTYTTADGNVTAAFVLDRGYYLNISLTRQSGGLQASALAPLVSAAVASLP
jgi:hypothetical protein